MTEPGDPVCWLEQLCPDCAAMPSPETGPRCWRCGRRLDVDDDHPTTRGTTDE